MLTLYSGITCPFSPRCRIVLHEKHPDFRVIDVDPVDDADDSHPINPAKGLPVLIERDLIIYGADIIDEYIEERFPVPPLMPVAPQNRAQVRQVLSTMAQELFSHVDALEKNLKSADKSRAHVTDRLVELSAQFTKQQYLLGNEFSMPDVALAPLLWRLERYGIELPKTAAPLLKYAHRIFERPSFVGSLTPTEKTMRS
jgi:RNA polymerase-associated protein